MMKVETVHCSACSVYIPALHSSVQQHLKSPDHIKGKQVSFDLSLSHWIIHQSLIVFERPLFHTYLLVYSPVNLSVNN